MLENWMARLAVLAGALAVLPAQAATISAWNLAGAPGSQASTAASAAAPNVSGASITRGAGLSGNAGANSFNSSGWESAGSGSTTNEFVSFGFTVASGYTVDLEALYVGTRSSGSGPGTVGLFYSGDGFASAILTIAQPTDTFVNSIIDLADLPLLTGAVEFRIYQIGNTSANGGTTASAGTFRLTGYFENGVFNRDMQFTGTVAPIPLPAAAWLLLSGLAALGFAGGRRRA